MLLVHEMLEQSSLDCPDKEAIVCEQRRLSYREIEEASTKLANFLISHGVNIGDRIGIFSNKDIEEIIAIFAILKVGALFVHINPQFKENQLSHVISDCSIKVLCVNDIKAAILEKAYPDENPLALVISLSPKINLDHDIFQNVYYLDDILKESSTNKITSVNLNEDDTASIIYTSGSTGMPKGVVVTHKIFSDSTTISASVLENNINDRLINTAPFSFDGALSQLFTMFLVKGTIVLQKSSFPRDIVKTLLTEQITGFHAVPSLWIMLLQRHSPLAKNRYPFLRYISTIGEVFPQNYLIELKNILDKTNIYIMYGITEAFRSTYLPPGDFEKKPLSVGKPFPGVEILVVDEQGRICEHGEIGEIVHRGVFISPGYWNNPEKTLETFKENSLYTGDLGKLDDEGYLYFIGRKDGMIKTNGYRVSPDEIEQCLYQIEEIREAAVIGVPDDKIGNTIKAVVACKDENDLSPSWIINYCKKRLPYYMVPRIVEFRDNLPRTSTNKINKSALL